MMRLPGTVAVAFGVMFSGCASVMSGVGGSEHYACKAPEGVTCTSVSGAYANSMQATPRPTQLPATRPPPLPALYGAMPIASGSAVPLTKPASTIRSNPRLLRVWIAPWEDSDGDLHEESIVHVIVDTGRWLIEHVRPAQRSRIDGVAPPLAAPEATPLHSPSETQVPTTRLPLPPGAGAFNPDSTPAER